MEIRKTLLYVILGIIGVALWTQWQRDYPPAPSSSYVQQAADNNTTNDTSSYAPSTYAPDSFDSSHSKTASHSTHLDTSKDKQLVRIKTDVLSMSINLNGGDLDQSAMLTYPETEATDSPPIAILNDDPAKLFIAQSNITNISSSDSHSPIQFTASQKNYVMQPGQDSLSITLKGKSDNGLVINKTYTFKRGQYNITVDQTIKNTANSAWKGSFYQQIVRRDVPSSTQQIRSFNGASISSKDKPYEKLSFKNLNKTPVDQVSTSGWVAMQQPYFLAAWVPTLTKALHYYSHVTPTQDSEHKLYTIGYTAPQITLQPNQSATNTNVFYVGPEIADNLRGIAHGLDLTIDYGILSPISKLIFTVMNAIHGFVGNWGWSIILVTLLIKIIFYYPSAKSYQSMAKMRAIAPRLSALKDRYADDKAGLSRATMEIYKTEKVNPAGGCLPMIIQIPVFFALYYVLIESIQLRHAPFIFWIHDLSSKDPYHILPLLMGASMFIQQRLSPSPPDPTQAKMMMAMPIVFTFVFMSFPAGLVLYWLTNNCISIAQQWYVTKTYKPKKSDWKRKKK